VINPTPANPWVIGQKNLLAWRVASDTGVEAFDVQLHNVQHGVLSGAVKIARNVPMQRLSSGYKNYGGQIEVDLDGTIPTGDGFIVAFVETVHGGVYTLSDPFSIVADADKPANYTDRPGGLPTATVTATLHDKPNPTMDWAITMSGKGVEITAPAWIAEEKAKTEGTS
jgi:hypothetical protein